MLIVQESIEKVKYHFFPTTMRRWVVQLDWVRPALYKLMFQYITFYSRLLAYRHLSKIWEILTTFSYIIPKFTEELTLSSQNMISNKNLLSSLLFFRSKRFVYFIECPRFLSHSHHWQKKTCAIKQALIVHLLETVFRCKERVSHSNGNPYIEDI